MDQWNLVKDITRAYIAANRPNECEMFEKYVALHEVGGEQDEGASSARNFGLMDLSQVDYMTLVFFPLLINMLSSILFELFKNRLTGRASEKVEPAAALVRLRKNRRRIEKQLVKKVQNEAVVREVLNFMESYLEGEDGQGRSAHP